MKQETLEEVAERIYREYPTNPIDKPQWHYNRDINCFRKRKAFIAGAKWQQERSYSEEEVKEMVYHMVGGLAQANNMTFNGAILDELFNKLKNK